METSLPYLQLQWKDVVSDECDGDTYVGLKGIVPGIIRGHNLTAVKPCYVRFVKLFGPQDLAKRMQRYMATYIAINTGIVSVRQGIGRMQGLNNLLPYMPAFATNRIVRLR